MSAAGRRWLEVRARCSAPADERALLAGALVGLGSRGVEERNGAFLAYFEEPDDPAAFLRALTAELERETGLEGVRVESDWQDHEEWAETWKRGLGERRLTARVVVHPSWVRPTGVRQDDVVIVLDPGMAFGTAEHGTTRGCIRLLDRVVEPGDRVLDVGAGSGILSIVAARLGAASVVAIEGDALACEALAENIGRNGVADRVRVEQRWATAEDLSARGPVSGVVANIEAALLEPLLEGFANALGPGGWLIVSGILDHEWDSVRAGVEAHGFRFVALDEDGVWRSARLERSRADALPGP